MSAVEAPSPSAATHGVHPTETPSPDRKLPFGHKHSVGLVAWVWRVVEPPGHEMQAKLPEPSLYEPCGHEAHPSGEFAAPPKPPSHSHTVPVRAADSPVFGHSIGTTSRVRPWSTCVVAASAPSPTSK